MNIKSQHEVYIQLKMFESIGFHHQGNYSIMMQCYDRSGQNKTKQFAVPFAKAKRFKQQQFENEQGRANVKKLQFQSARFDVSFNQQQIIFNNNYCVFKLQHLIQSAEDCKKQLYLQFKLIRHKSSKNSDQTGQTEQNAKNMCSTDNVIKVTMDEAAEETQKTKKNCFSALRFRRQKSQEVACITVMTIRPDSQSISNPTSIYQSIIFSDHQYFGKLFFTIMHTKLGYKIRKIQKTLTSYVIQKLDRIEKGGRKEGRKKKEIVNEYLAQNPINLLKNAFPNIYSYFQIFLVSQLQCYNQLLKLQQDLQYQSLSSSTKLKDTKNTYKAQKQPLIMCPDTDMLHNVESLIEFYQASSLDNLYLIIYQQMLSLTDLLLHRLFNIRKTFQKIKWSSTYFAKYSQNIKFQVQNIYKTKVNLLNAPQNYESRSPNLKYMHYVHEDIPNFYIHKKGQYKNSFGNVSDEHTLFVLVHGFNGNEFDMNRIKSFISFFSTPYFLIIRNITNRIYESLDTLGEIAAQQISEFLKLKPFIKKINFIGYSLGGIIIRSSLRYLKRHHSLFNIFITLSSPHLGVKQTQSCMVRTGLYYLSRFRGAINIKQFLLEPEQGRAYLYEQNKQSNNSIKQKEEQICYLERLSADPLIGVFRLAIFFGSENDKYVPGSSATLDYSGPSVTINRMQQNLLKNLNNLHQIYVKFDQKKKGSYWDHLTGRRIHINFLDYDPFLYFLSAHYYDIF